MKMIALHSVSVLETDEGFCIITNSLHKLSFPGSLENGEPGCPEEFLGEHLW